MKGRQFPRRKKNRRTKTNKKVLRVITVRTIDIPQTTYPDQTSIAHSTTKLCPTNNKETKVVEGEEGLYY